MSADIPEHVGKDLVAQAHEFSQKRSGKLMPEELREAATTTAVRVQSRPDFTDAMYLTTDNQLLVLDWLLNRGSSACSIVGGIQVADGLGNAVTVPYYHWAVIDPRGYPYPCHPEVFAVRWEKAGH